MEREVKSQYRNVIITLIQEYTNAQNHVISIAGYDVFDEWAKSNKHVDGMEQEILFRNIMAWINELNVLRFTDETLGLTSGEVERLKTHTWCLDFYIQCIQDYEIAVGYQLIDPFPEA